MDKKEFEQRARETSEYQLAPDGKGNTQLPAGASAELSQFIKNKIEIEREYWNNNPSADSDRAKTYVAGYGKGLSDGATEYAIKLHKVETVLALYKQADKTNSDLIERAVTLLEKVIYRHEGGLLPDRFIYNEIKTFLDGTT